MVKYLIVAIALLGHLNTYAHQAESGTATYSYGLSLEQTTDDGLYGGYEGHIMPGLLLSVTADMTDFSGLELNLNYKSTYYYRDYTNRQVVEKAQRMIIYFGYRFWMTSNWGLGSFVYTNYSMGQVKSLYRSPSASNEFMTSAHELAKEGFSLSVVKDFKYNTNKIFSVDLRYQRYFHLPKGERDESTLLLFSFKTVKPKFI